MAGDKLDTVQKNFVIFMEEMAVKLREAYWRGIEDTPQESSEETAVWMHDFLSRIVDYLMAGSPHQPSEETT